jgi:hypothetical protein
MRIEVRHQNCRDDVQHAADAEHYPVSLTDELPQFQ